VDVNVRIIKGPQCAPLVLVLVISGSPPDSRLAAPVVEPKRDAVVSADAHRMVSLQVSGLLGTSVGSRK
jgi:hypothetical protein